MCCRVTGADFTLVLLLAVLVALAITAPKPFRFRGFLATVWMLMPVWVAAIFAAILVQNGQAADGWFAASIFIALFQLPWLLAAGVGLLLGVAIRRVLQRFATFKQRHGDHHV